LPFGADMNPSRLVAMYTMLLMLGSGDFVRLMYQML
jgi:hypothetical protein